MMAAISMSGENGRMKRNLSNMKRTVDSGNMWTLLACCWSVAALICILTKATDKLTNSNVQVIAGISRGIHGYYRVVLLLVAPLQFGINISAAFTAAVSMSDMNVSLSVSRLSSGRYGRYSALLSDY